MYSLPLVLVDVKCIVGYLAQVTSDAYFSTLQVRFQKNQVCLVSCELNHYLTWAEIDNVSQRLSSRTEGLRSRYNEKWHSN